MFCVLVTLVACTQDVHRKEVPIAVKGVLDLRQWDFFRDGPLNLSGEWEFYWGKFLNREDSSPMNRPEGMNYIRVPGVWNGNSINGSKISGSGYATYHLKVLLKQQNIPMAFKFLSMGTAFRLYVNGQEISSDGIVGATRETMAPDWRPHIACFRSEEANLDIILHVSNFNHRKGGIVEAIKLGSEKDIQRTREKSLAFDLFLGGSLFIMGLYHLVLFFIGKKDRAPLYFGIFCLLISLYGLLSGERYFAQLFPETDWEFRVRLTNLTSFMSAPVSLLFIRSLFPKEINRVFLCTLISPLIFLCLVVVFFPARIYSHLIPVFHIIAIIVAMYIIYVLVIGFRRKREGSLILLAGTCVVVSAAINDILYDNISIRTGQFLHLGIFISVFSQSILLSVRFSKAFKTVERQRQELVGTNIAIMQEIDMRKKTEDALKESEEKYRLLVENASEAIFIVQDYSLKFYNRRTEEITGHSREELAKIPFLDHVHPGDKDMVLKQHIKTLAGKKLPSGASFRIVTKSGEEKWCAVNTVALTWEGRPAGLCFAWDVTQEKKLEASLQRAHKMEAIGTLAGGVAHDLNNVLSGIVSYPDLLLMQLPKESHLRPPIETIKLTGQKAAAIVMDLLTLARRGVATNEIVNLNDVVLDYLKSPEYETLISFNERIKVETNLSKDLLNMLGSPFHLSKTLMNLVSNAVEAMPDGGRLSISTENRHIDRPIRDYEQIDEGDYVTLTISDTGIGISPADRERIFEPFYTRKVMGRSGTGLGMAVVWGTVKDHNGHIDLKSSVGAGTMFTLYFPGTREDKVDKSASLSLEDYKGRGETILVVDDVQEQREIASAILTQLGYSVMAFSSGEKAVEYLKDHSVELLVLDMIMAPGIDGLETYKRILMSHPGQKAIITSGFSETKRVKEAESLGVGTYIKKPYTLEVLGLAVRAELDKT